MSDGPEEGLRQAESRTDVLDPGDRSTGFEAPWQARAFALGVALTDEDDVPWRSFQSRLVEAIEAGGDGDDERSDETVYYDQWLAALERLLVERGLLDREELLERVGAFENGERDAHEFVEGDPHDHVDRLPDRHAEGSHRDHGHDH